MYEAVVKGIRVHPTIESVLYRTDEISKERIDRIRRAAGNKLLQVAATALGPDIPLVIRNINPTDMEETTDKYALKDASVHAYDEISVSGATMADNRFAVIYGCRLLSEVATNGGFVLTPLVTNIRFTIGGSVVAKWDLYKLYVRTGDAAVAGATATKGLSGITDSPIIISQNTPIVVESFGVSDVTAGVLITYDGLVCEPVGKVLKP